MCNKENSEINYSYLTIKTTYPNCKLIASADEAGQLYELENGEVLLVSNLFIAEEKDENNTEKNKNLIEYAKKFSSVKEVFLFLRKSKQDNATYFELSTLIDPLIKELYKNRIIDLKEVLGEV